MVDIHLYIYIYLKKSVLIQNHASNELCHASLTNIYIFIYLSVRLSVALSMSGVLFLSLLSVCLSLSVFLYTCRSFYLSVRLSVGLST